MTPQQISDLRLHADNQNRGLHANLDKLRHVLITASTDENAENLKFVHKVNDAYIKRSTGLPAPKK